MRHLVVVGRFELRAHANRVLFAFMGWRALRQAMMAEGCRRALVRSESDRLYYVLGVWESAAAMRAYRDGGWFARTMRWFGEGRLDRRFTCWKADTLPERDAAIERFEMLVRRQASSRKVGPAASKRTSS